ncbi:hypothetical protein Pfo_018250 [Paulownia fortunei]|nr:hypothetical protein Pfo_018250 [Paulownia fortunei]
MNLLSADHHNLCKNMIARLLTGIVQCDPTYEIKYVQQNVKNKYHLKWARKNIYRTWESSVRKLPKYLGAMDETHLYTKYIHKMLIVVGMDANQQVLHLAFAIIDEEIFTS